MDAKELSIALRGCFDIDERGRGIWESEKAESLISSALSAQAAEVERLKDALNQAEKDFDELGGATEDNYDFEGIRTYALISRNQVREAIKP